MFVCKTGPIFDHTTFTTSGKYLYLEPTTDCFQAEARLVSPCLDLTSLNQATLSFWYHMYGADMGSLHVDVYANSIWTENIITPISGHQGNLWNQALVDLSQYYGQIINIRFRGITGNDEKSDMAIDDIELTGTVGLESDNLSLASRINIYPNPSNGVFNISIKNPESESYDLYVMDLLGRKIIERNITDLNKDYNDKLDLSTLKAGVYYLKVVSEKEEYNTKLNLY